MVRAWDCATGASIAVLEGRPQSVYSLLRSPLAPQLASVSTDTNPRHRDGDTDDSFSTLNTNPDRYLSSKMLPMSLCESKIPPGATISKALYQVATAMFLLAPGGYSGNFRKAAAFGCDDGRVIILDLTQLILQVT